MCCRSGAVTQDTLPGKGPVNADTAARLERGRALFNEGRYFEAHEAWEEAWLAERGDARRLLQGLIQVAAGCHKAGQGKAEGCARLLAAGLEKLEPLAAAYGIEDFARALALVHARALSWVRGQAPDAGPIPVLPPVGPGPGRQHPAR
jgi:predicted metal-dependent hydrolase